MCTRGFRNPGVGRVSRRSRRSVTRDFLTVPCRQTQSSRYCAHRCESVVEWCGIGSPNREPEESRPALRFLDFGSIPDTPRDIRDWLVDAPGVGPKTASWIVRNRFACDEVAIIDIHIRRAGEAAGVFDRRWRVERDYPKYEALFLAWAEHGGVRASILDACIWSELASLGSTDLPTRHP